MLYFVQVVVGILYEYNTAKAHYYNKDGKYNDRNNRRYEVTKAMFFQR